MPKELIAVGPRTPILREYEEPPLEPTQVRVKSTLSAVKHGTTLSIYRGGDPFQGEDLRFQPSFIHSKRNGERMETHLPDEPRQYDCGHNH